MFQSLFTLNSAVEKSGKTKWCCSPAALKCRCMDLPSMDMVSVYANWA